MSYFRVSKVALISVLSILAFGSCFGGSSGSAGVSGVIEADTYSVPSGETVQVSGALTIHTVNDVTIDGALSANGATGQSITIISDNGNITISDTGSISAGDGAPGALAVARASARDSVSRTISGGGGGNGGSVILKAPNGTITISNREGVIYIGNGGAGVEINVQGNDLLSTESLEGDLLNRGGDSGIMQIEARQVTGVNTETQTAITDIIDPSTGQTVYPAGTSFTVISDQNVVSGGQGGDAGNYYWGTDANGNSTWPDGSTARQYRTAPYSPDTSYSIWTSVTVTGANGGKGWTRGGNGAAVARRGGDGIGCVVDNSISEAKGADGQEVIVNGGDGGACRFGPRSCTPGNGGWAMAIGGNGASVTEPTCRGGAGGRGSASGGWADCISSLIGSAEACGIPGNAYAWGGDGGRGGGRCPDNVVDNGPAGGMGGKAFAMGGSASFNVGIPVIKSNADIAKAVSGGGGDGGDGKVTWGQFGFSGEAEAISAVNKTATEGKDGQVGKECPSTGGGDTGGGSTGGDGGTGGGGTGGSGTIDKSCSGVTHHSGYSTVKVCIKTSNVPEGQPTSFMASKGSSASGGGTVGSDGVGVSCWTFDISSYGSYEGIAAVLKDGLTWLQTNWSINVGSSPQSCDL